MNFYNTVLWDRTRRAVLRRDEYLCQECKRYGKTKSAEVVHHIRPLEKHPELRVKTWNLISLCRECHEAMHERKTNELTEKGLNWIRRTEKFTDPPTSEDGK